MLRRCCLFAVGLAAVVIAGCGGGGGGSSSPPITITASPPSLAASATTTTAAPTASLQLTASSIPSGGLFVGVANTSNGIASTSLSSAGSAEDVTVTFKSPSALGVGVFNDTLTIEICLDQQCAQQISSSPLHVAVSYVVAAGNPATAMPTLTALTPPSVLAAGASFTLVATGGNFAPSTVLMWNGQARATTYVSPTSLSATINASDIANAGTATVTVSNASTGGGVSSPTSFLITAPTPSLTAISPSTVGAGGAAFMLAVTGAGFDASAQISWNGSFRQTTYVSPTQVTAQITAVDIGTTGSFPVTVTNLNNPSAPSNALQVTVINAPLSLTSVSPASVTAGSPALVETIIGTGFSSGSTVQWNGSARNTTFVSTTELLAEVSAADVAGVGTASVTVVNTGSNAGTSSAQTVTVTAPSIDAVAFQINPQHNGAINFANIIAPSAFPLTSSWTALLDGPPSYALVAGGRVFATVSLVGGGSELVALSAATGVRLWGPIALPYAANAAYENGRVFVLSANIGTPGMLSAYDAASGTRLWSIALTSQYWFTGPPTAANGFVYVGGAGSGGTLYAVDETNGALTWTSQVQNGDNSSPSVTADGVYVSYPCQTYDFRPRTGELVWNNSTGCEGGGGATGLVANGVAYSPNGPAGFAGMSFNAETGAFLSSYTADVPPAIGSQMGYFLQGGTLRAIALSSETVQWSFAGDGTLTTAPILVNNFVFISASSGMLYALDATSGALLWQINLGASMTSGSNGYGLMQASGLSAGDGLLVVPVGNKLTAFTLSTNP